MESTNTEATWRSLFHQVQTLLGGAEFVWKGNLRNELVDTLLSIRRARVQVVAQGQRVTRLLLTGEQEGELAEVIVTVRAGQTRLAAVARGGWYMATSPAESDLDKLTAFAAAVANALLRADLQPSQVAAPRPGAPRLKERLDWPSKLEKLKEYEGYIARGTPAKVAADLVGYPPKTLRRWKKERDAQDLTNKGQ